MKSLFLSITLILSSTLAFCQISGNQINEIIDNLESRHLSEEEIKTSINVIIEDPELYNSAWKNFLDQAISKDSNWQLLRDLNIQFKTFQTEDNPNASLGLSYDFDYDYANFSEGKKNNRISNSIGLTSRGNIAFKNNYNPNDFLESNLNYTFSHFLGGIVKANDKEILDKLNEIEDELVKEKDINSENAIKKWEEFNSLLGLSNQYYYSFSPKAGFENNQDFSKTQFTPGLELNLGAKAWNSSSTLAKLNIFDYPFAILRYITGTDNTFRVYGSTIPTVQLAFDYVIPTSDSVREGLLKNDDPFPRFKFETGFRTFITRVKKENIFFNANYRYYKEINAPEEIVKAKLAQTSYFVMALQTTSGFYVSYANGKLPFDAKNDEVYSLGFNYKFDK